MSKFLRRMTAISQKPSDFKRDDSRTIGSPPSGSQSTALQPPAPFNPAATKTRGTQSSGTQVIPSQTIGPRRVHRVFNQPTVYRISRVQDGLDPMEWRIYDVLWRSATFISELERERTVGYMKLCDETGLSHATIKRKLKTLQTKFILTVTKSESREENIGRTYRISSYKQILERWQQAGMTHVVRNRGGVQFTAEPMVCKPRVPDPESSVSMVYQPSPVARNPRLSEPPGVSEGDSQTTGPGVYKSSYPLGLISTRTTTTTTPAELFGSLEALLPSIDEGATARIWEVAREAIEDVTPTEVAYFFAQRLPFVLRSKRVDNPVGLMIATAGDWITARKVQQRREALAQDEERRRRDEAEMAETMARVQAELARGRQD